MTIDRIALKELADKGSDADLLREMLACVASQLMELEVGQITCAGHGERTANPAPAAGDPNDSVVETFRHGVRVAAPRGPRQSATRPSGRSLPRRRHPGP